MRVNIAHCLFGLVSQHLHMCRVDGSFLWIDAPRKGEACTPLVAFALVRSSSFLGCKENSAFGSKNEVGESVDVGDGDGN